MNKFSPQDLIAARQEIAQPVIDSLFETIKNYMIANLGMLCGEKHYLRWDKTEDKRINILLCSAENTPAKIICEVRNSEEQGPWNMAMKIWVAKQVLQAFGAGTDGGISDYFVL